MAADPSLRIRYLEALKIPPSEGLCNHMYIYASPSGYVKTSMYMRCTLAKGHKEGHHCSFHTTVWYRTDGCAAVLDSTMREAAWPADTLSYDKLVPEDGSIVPLLILTHTQLGKVIESYNYMVERGYDFNSTPKPNTGNDTQQLEDLMKTLRLGK